MEDFLGILLFAGAIFVLYIVAALVGAAIGVKTAKKYKAYLKTHFPQLPDDVDMLVAKQKSKKMGLSIGMVINDPAQEIIVIGKGDGKELQHRVFQYSDLSAAESSHQVIKRGALWQKTFSYERTLLVRFKDGSAFSFIMENISNRAGSDKGSRVVIDAFRPWEEKLNQILHHDS